MFSITGLIGNLSDWNLIWYKSVMLHSSCCLSSMSLVGLGSFRFGVTRGGTEDERGASGVFLNLHRNRGASMSEVYFLRLSGWGS